MNADLLAREVHGRQCSDPDLVAYALAYGVGFPALYAELMQWFGPETANSRLSLIFDARPEEGNAQYGPFLVRLARGKEQPSRLLARLVECCFEDFRAISFLFSSLELDQLMQAFRERLDVVCEDRSEWQVKFFDTRSLGVLYGVLESDQKKAFFGVADEWWYLNRSSDLQRIRCERNPADHYRGPLRLTEQQAKAIIDASLPDSVLHSLSRTDDDLIAQFDSRTRYEICAQSVARASDAEKNSTVLLADRVRMSLIEALNEIARGE